MDDDPFNFEEIFNLIEVMGQDCEDSIQECRDNLQSCSEKLEAVEESCGQVDELQADIADGITDRLEDASEQFASWTSDLDEALKLKSDRLQAVQKLITEMIGEKWSAMDDCVADVRGNVCETFQKHLQESVTRVIDSTPAAIQDGIGESAEELMSLGEGFSDEIKDALAGLSSYVVDELRNMIQEEVRITGHAAMERVKSEVVDSIVTTQVQAQITSMLSPILPQLIAAKTLAPAIRQGLEILRGGF